MTEELKAAVERLLESGDFPIYRAQDDNGLAREDYLAFATRLLASLQAPCLGKEGELRVKVRAQVQDARSTATETRAQTDAVLDRATDAILALLSVQPVLDGQDLVSVGSGLTPLVPSREDDTGPATPSEGVE